MIRLKQPLVLSAQSSPLFTAAAAASSQQRRASSAGGRLKARRISCTSTEEAMGVSTSVTTKERHLTVKAIVTAQAPTSMYVSRGLDDIQDLFGKTLLLELVSSELDPGTGREKEKVKGFAHMTLKEGRYEAEMSAGAYPGGGEQGLDPPQSIAPLNVSAVAILVCVS